MANQGLRERKEGILKFELAYPPSPNIKCVGIGVYTFPKRKIRARICPKISGWRVQYECAQNCVSVTESAELKEAKKECSQS